MIGRGHGDQQVDQGVPEGVKVGGVLCTHKVIVGSVTVRIQGGHIGDVGVGGEENGADHAEGEEVEEEEEEDCKYLGEGVPDGLCELFHYAR